MASRHAVELILQITTYITYHVLANHVYSDKNVSLTRGGGVDYPPVEEPDRRYRGGDAQTLPEAMREVLLRVTSEIHEIVSLSSGLLADTSLCFRLWCSRRCVAVCFATNIKRRRYITDAFADAINRRLIQCPHISRVLA